MPEAWLVESDHQDLADSVDRLQGDVDLVTALALAKYEGDLYDYFANELAKYGYAVLKSWIAKKIMFERCKQKGFGLRVLERDFTQQEIEGLANYTVAMALNYFREKVLMKRRWDPTKGASLRTFFIGQCVFQFPNIYRDFLDDLDSDWLHGYTDDVLEMDFYTEHTSPVDRRVIAAIVSSQAMAEITDRRVRRAMVMTAEGYTQPDIARVLGVSTKAVERMLARARESLPRKELG
ncbi:sigma factor-like helix-turn-helix DNA-binding protein [Nocardioides kribbensis]|uniref:sigma-70 region 4 domain-containing protein n=1 Tax=Nocardioides kribbensis TaxID=305517 RepID=UPI001879B294|nr:sigma-70 region 4 domain-containing protein [Nocardioides kribbensis]